ncbi:MAG TPA: LysR family transcriptional regulator [Candidatus Enterenecus merdae]|nr:LysR family transcriptional regulator [Candidatus Enterenecus merdae]
MELRTLRYFLEIAREGNMTRAAQRLYLSQPALSRQMKGLEDELGRTLFIRHSFHIELTQEGMLLRKRAEDILGMVDKTKAEFRDLDGTVGGEVFLGCAESEGMKRVAQVMAQVKTAHPGVRFHLKSGNTEDLTGDLDKGLLDLAVIAQPVEQAKYHFLPIPLADVWGAVLPREHPLARKRRLTARDLEGEALIVSRQGMLQDYPKLFGERQEKLNIAATFNLPYNGSVLVQAGLGIMLCFEGLIDTGEGSGLCFRPLWPRLESEGNVIWKKRQVFTPAASALLEALKTSFGPADSAGAPPARPAVRGGG